MKYRIFAFNSKIKFPQSEAIRFVKFNGTGTLLLRFSVENHSISIDVSRMKQTRAGARVADAIPA